MSEPTSRITTANGPLARVEESHRLLGLLSSHIFGPTLAKSHSTARDQVRPQVMALCSDLRPLTELNRVRQVILSVRRIGEAYAPDSWYGTPCTRSREHT